MLRMSYAWYGGALLLIGGLAAASIAACPSGPGPLARREAASPRLECEIRGYPCTWGEVPAELRERGLALTSVLSRLRAGGGTDAAAAEILASLPSVVDIQLFDGQVRFRLEGTGPFQVSPPDALDHHRGTPEMIAATSAPDPASPRPRRAPRSSLFSRLFRLAGPETLFAQSSQAVQGIAAETPGTPKKALILAPYEWQFYGVGGAMAQRMREIRDYSEKVQGSEVSLWANLDAWTDNPEKPDSVLYRDRRGADGAMLLKGEVHPDQFNTWDDYNTVIVASHGTAWPCPWASPEVVSKTGDYITWTEFVVANPEHSELCPLIWGGRARSAAYLGYPGLVLSTNTVEREIANPMLTGDEARQCAERIAGGEQEPVLSSGTGEVPCTLQKPEAMTSLQFTFEFFESAYPAGLNNTVVFLAACRSGLNHYLLDQLTGRPPRPGASAAGTNRNVAAFGFDKSVDAGDAWATVREFLRLDKLGFHSAEKLKRVKEMDRTAHLVGSVLAPEDEPPSLTPPEIVEREHGKTHSRDIVLLVDPATGEELLDGATVQVVRTGGSGGADRLAVHPQLLGVTEEEAPPNLGLQVSVVGESVPPETYVPHRLVEEGAYRYANTVALGRDHRVGEVVDLEVRADLPGGGESRWIYRNVSLNSCHWEAELSGYVNRRVRGSRISVSSDLLGKPGPMRRDGILGSSISLAHDPGPEGAYAITLNFPGQAQELGPAMRIPSLLWERPITWPISESDDGTVRLTTIKPGESIAGEFEVEFDSVLQFPENRQTAPITVIERPVHVTGRFVWTPPCQPMSLKEQGEDLLQRMKLDPEWRQKFGEGRKK